MKTFTFIFILSVLELILTFFFLHFFFFRVLKFLFLTHNDLRSHRAIDLPPYPASIYVCYTTLPFSTPITKTRAIASNTYVFSTKKNTDKNYWCHEHITVQVHGIGGYSDHHQVVCISRHRFTILAPSRRSAG